MIGQTISHYRILEKLALVKMRATRVSERARNRARLFEARGASSADALTAIEASCGLTARAVAGILQLEDITFSKWRTAESRRSARLYFFFGAAFLSFGEILDIGK